MYNLGLGCLAEFSLPLLGNNSIQYTKMRANLQKWYTKKSNNWLHLGKVYNSFFTFPR